MEMVLNWWMVCILLATGHFIPAAAKSFSIQSTISAHKYNVHRSGVSVNSRGANGRALKALDESNFAGQSILVSSERNVASPAALKDAEFHIRIIMLLFYATLGSLLPYLPVYYRHLGLDGKILCLSLSHPLHSPTPFSQTMRLGCLALSLLL